MRVFRVRYGESCRVVHAQSANAAIAIVLNEYEAEWGAGSFDQYDVEVEDHGECNGSYPLTLAD